METVGDIINSLPPVGHNEPPPELLAKADALLTTADRWVRERPIIATEEIAGRAADFLRQLTATESALDRERKAKKRPHQDAAAAVEAIYKPALDKLAAAKDAIKRLIAAWQRKLEERLAEERRKAEEAAAEARRKAEELQRLADQSFAPSAAVAAQNAVHAAEQAELRAHAAAGAKAQVRGTLSSRAVSSRTIHRALVKDYAAALAFYAKHPDVVSVVERLAGADARRGICAPGCEIIDEKSVA